MASVGTRASGFESELRISPRLLVVALLVSGVALGMVEQVWAWGPKALALAVLLEMLAGTGWLLEQWNPWLGRWSVVLSVLAVVCLLNSWLAVPGALVLVALPVVVAAGVVGIPAATAVAGGQTLLLLCNTRGMAVASSAAERLMALAAIWGVLGMLAGMYRPIHLLSTWWWQHFRRAQELVGEARDRGAQLQQALLDLAHANRQLASTNEKLAAARLAAEEAQKTKAAFVANVSHEFRTPLNMIIGLTDLLLETPGVYGHDLPATLLEDLEIVRRNCEHLANMINDVLDLSQVEAGRLALHKERVDLGDIIDRALSVVRPLLESKGLGLTIDMPQDLPLTYCDRTRIRQVIVNLLSNAARFTEKGGITVRVVRDGQHVTVAVEDTGPGVSAEDAVRVFEPFYQGSRGPQARGGSGLGLSISRQFVELHDGKMWLESQVGVGSIFSFKLPISPPIGPVAGPGRWIAEEWTWLERTSRADLPITPLKPRFVLCDRTGELYPLFSRYLNEVDFVDTRSPSQAVEEAKRHAAQALLLNAPEASSLHSMVEEVRAKVPDTPIICCCLPPRAEGALAAGAAGYLLKPVLRADLWHMIQGVGRPIGRVLIVDDEADAQQLIARMLHACDARLQVAAATTATQALYLLRHDPPDLVLVDIALPDMDGWQFLAAKASDEAIRDIPAVVVSAQDPRDRPLASQALLASIGDGLSISKLLRCSQALSALLLQPD